MKNTLKNYAVAGAGRFKWITIRHYDARGALDEYFRRADITDTVLKPGESIALTVKRLED